VSFRNRYTGPVPPSLAAIVAAVDAAPNVTDAANNSATARIRSMTRVSFTMLGPSLSTSAAISVTSINRSQITLLASRCVNIPAGDSDSPYVPGISAVSNTAISLTRQSSAVNTDAAGFVEVMEWI
jgi:hypothetical protein